MMFVDLDEAIKHLGIIKKRTIQPNPTQPLAQRLAKATLVEGDNSQVARIRHWDELIITVGLMPNVNNTLCQEIVKYFNLAFASKVSLLSEHVAALHSVQLITRKPKDVVEKMRAARKYYFESGNYCRDIGRRVPGDLNSVKIRFVGQSYRPIKSKHLGNFSLITMRTHESLIVCLMEVDKDLRREPAWHFLVKQYDR